jgi:hypothetical protein
MEQEGNIDACGLAAGRERIANLLGPYTRSNDLMFTDISFVLAVLNRYILSNFTSGNQDLAKRYYKSYTLP